MFLKEIVMPKTSVLFYWCAVGIFSSRTMLADPRAEEIIRMGEKQTRGETTQAIMVMDILRPDYTRRLKVRAWTLGHQHALVEILDPLKEEGVCSLRVRSEMWNYLPKTDQVVRIPTSLMLQSWMGSDFTNDDLMKASSLIRDYRHRWLRQEKVGGDRTHLIECLPKPDAPVVWGKILYWARTKDNLPVKQQFFDDSGKLVRTLTFSSFRKMDDRIIPTLVRVDKADSPRERTTVSYEKILYDRRLSQQIFDKEEIRGFSREGKVLTAGWFLPPIKAKMPVPARQKVKLQAVAAKRKALKR